MKGASEAQICENITKMKCFVFIVLSEEIEHMIALNKRKLKLNIE
jgi:hypothetical protein